MSDASVASALRSAAPLVVVEAPAGCGKTFQGASYARDTVGQLGNGRVLILTHTHAACDVFAKKTRGFEGQVTIRTIDSLLGEVASVYHRSLGIPSDTGSWARSRPDGFAQLADKVAALLSASPTVAQSLAIRYPVLICDEHQDASADQHSIAMAHLEAGTLVRVFGDPMQRIFGNNKKALIAADEQRWENLKQRADAMEELDYPHRWANGSLPFGEWILATRRTLQSGGRIDLRGTLPPGVSVIVAENQSPSHGGYRLGSNEAKSLYAHANKSASSLLVLAAHNETVGSLHAFFGRRLPIWEGHVRQALEVLICDVQKYHGDAANIARVAVTFLNSVATGFSPSAYGNTFVTEVSAGCVTKRNGKPATLQSLGRMILDEPNHRGVSKFLRRLNELRATDPQFAEVKINYHREFWDGIKLGEFDDPKLAFTEISRRRSHVRPLPPERSISTVHKAKGLECEHVLIVPCDAKHFGESPAARCRLYVAMSRAKRSLTFVVSRNDPSPLIAV